MWGQPIQVSFQKRDLPIYTTITIASTPSTTARLATSAQPSSTAVAQAAATAASPISTLKPSNGISTGAKADIGAGAALAVTFPIALVVFLLWRRRANARLEQQRMLETMARSDNPDSKEMTISFHEEVADIPPPAELEQPDRELDSDSRVEMPERHDTRIAEMC